MLASIPSQQVESHLSRFGNRSATPIQFIPLYYRWLFFGAGPVEQAWTNKAMGFAVPADKERMAGYGNFAKVMDVLEQAVSQGPYLAGSSFTAADLYIGSHLGFGMQFGMIDKRPAFERYVANLMARPAALKAKQIDDAPPKS
jgi:glutathione S-transferase